MTECTRCGACCEAIGLSFAQEDVRADPEAFEARFRRWILDELVPIPVEEVYRRLPAMRDAERHMAGFVVMRHWYHCPHYDRDSRLCRSWEDRPGTCAGFPWYGDKPWAPAMVGFPDCSYRADCQDELNEIATELADETA